MRGRDALLAGLLLAAAAGAVAIALGRRAARSPEVDGATYARPGDADAPEAVGAPSSDDPGPSGDALAAGGRSRPGAPAPGQPRGDRRIGGRVTDADGRPVPGATVEGRALPPPPDGSRPPLTATTDAEGRFALEGLAAGRWAVLARHAGHAGAAPVVTETGATDLALRLARLGWIEGTVRRADGQELGEGFSVVVAADGGSSVGTRLPVRGGRFRSDGLLATTYVLGVTRTVEHGADDLVPASASRAVVSDGVAAVVDLVVQRGAVFRGRVEDAGTGAALAGVEVRGTLDAPSGSGGRVVAATTSADDGAFELAGLATGAWTFTTTSRTHAGERWVVPLDAEAIETRTLGLSPWATLTVSVRDEAGRPVHGAVVTVQRDGRPASAQRHGGSAPGAADPTVAVRVRFETDERGTVAIDVPPGDLTVVARGTTHAVSDPTPVTTRSGEGTRVEVVLRPRPAPIPRDR